MSKIVHVIGPGPLQRYHQEFPDNCINADILRQLRRNKAFFGRTKTVVKDDAALNGSPMGKDVSHADPESSFVLDDPATVVCVGVVHGNTFVETERLQGPPVVVEELVPPVPAVAEPTAEPVTHTYATPSPETQLPAGD